MDKLKASERLMKVEEARTNNKAKHGPTSQPRKMFALSRLSAWFEAGPQEIDGRSDGVRPMAGCERLAFKITIDVSSSNPFKI